MDKDSKFLTEKYLKEVQGIQPRNTVLVLNPTNEEESREVSIRDLQTMGINVLPGQPEMIATPELWDKIKWMAPTSRAVNNPLHDHPADETYYNKRGRSR